MNRLKDETSPYLLQHAENPVDWYPWGDEAFARAREEEKPIFLSIGYAACHWCHVMERESFAVPATAELMNENFVCIKVDREERPDVDSVYMDAAVAINGSGGWPLNVFLRADGKPFWAATYLPPEPRHDLRSFSDVLTTAADAWRDKREELEASSESLTDHIRKVSTFKPVDAPVDEELMGQAIESLTYSFDWEWGGWGRAPKFPAASALEFLFRRKVPRMTEKTLDAMAAGGMYDLVGGGFHRYSVDQRWLVPHFEKMLYDNALLAVTYLHGYQTTRDERYRRVVEQTVGYMLRELALDGGGFASSQDADTDGKEGISFTWTRTEADIPGPDAPHLRGRPLHPARRARRGQAGRALRAARAAAEAAPRRQGDRLVERSRAGGARRVRPRARAGGVGRRPPRRSASSCSGRSRRPTAGSTAPGATGSRRAAGSSRTTPTSRTGCSSCTPRPATCAGSRRRTASRGSRSTSSTTR